MNQSNHEWLDQTSLDDDIWIEMLVDGELSLSQRTTFIEHINRNNDWQRVATAFLDEQLLTASVQFDEPAKATHITHADKRTTSSVLPLLLVAASLLLGGLVGFFARQPETITITDVAPSEPANNTTNEIPLVAIDRSPSPPLPRLMQASNTPSEAVYYSDFSVPQFLLDALMIAGHEVELGQDFISEPGDAASPGLVPVNVIRVRKYQSLLASAASPQ